MNSFKVRFDIQGTYERSVLRTMQGVPRVGDEVEIDDFDGFPVKSVLWTPDSSEEDAVVTLVDRYNTI